MSDKRIILGPIIGAVSGTKTKIWFYGKNLESNVDKISCHAFAGGNVISGSPFYFEPISETEYKEHGNSYSAYLAEIVFPNSTDEISFKIVYPDQEISNVLEKYSVKPFPEKGDTNFSFGLISCHKAFTSKPGQKKRVKMWDYLYEKMKGHQSSFLIQCGDQVYCDAKENNAWGKSKNATNHVEMLNNYRNSYLDSWRFEEVQKVLSSFPQFMIWDDHEVTNGWGAKEKHFDEENMKIFKAATEAYYEFQHCHNPDPLVKGKFYYTFQFGSAAFLVMDLRGERNIKENRLINDDQWDAILKWLGSESVKQSKILFVVTSVPVVHLSRKFASLGSIKSDAADQWTYKNNRITRQKLLNALLNWSGNENKPVFILGGDVHVGTEVCILEESTKKKIHQITSSPITNIPAGFLDFIMAFFTKQFRFKLDDDKNEYIKAKIVRRHRRRNFGIIEVSYFNGKPKVMLYMYVKGKLMPRINNFMNTCKDLYSGEQ